jgi:cytochrome c biogenesis protein ResB
MGLGLVAVFYVVHARVWAVPVQEANGSLTLWVGGTANRNKDVFEQRFRKLVQEIESEIKVQTQSCAPAHATTFAGN